MMDRRRFFSATTLALLLLTLTACGGSSSGDNDVVVDSGSGEESVEPGDSTDQLPTDDSIESPNTTGFNGGLVGRVITTYDNKPVQLDLASGLMTEVPVDTIQDWLASNEVDPISVFSERSYFGVGGVASTQYIQSVTKCLPQEDSPLDYHACVAVYGADYQRVHNVLIRDRELYYAPKLSPTGRYLAFSEFWSFAGNRSAAIFLLDLEGLSYEDSLQIDLDGKIKAAASPLDWAPDGSLVYTVPSDDSVVIYFTEPGSLELANSIRLPALYQGEVESLDVSPDGTKLLVGYVPDGGIRKGGILLIDLETYGISVPAVVESEVGIVPLGDNIKGSIRSPRWSPDGQWIMMIQGRGNYFGPGVSTAAHLYAVPASKSRTVLTMESPTEAILINVQYPDRSDQLSDSWLANEGWEFYYDWVN